AASCSAPIRPASRSSRRALSEAGRSRLPTSSARNGGLFMWGAPIWPPTPPGARRAPGHPWRSSTLPSLLQLPPQKREHLLPRVLGLRGAIALGVREVEKCVARAFVAVEIVRLAVARELRVDLVDIR